MRKSTVIGALSGAVTSAALAALYVYRRSLPQVNGTLNVAGLNASVEILRDEWGVPHLYAENEDDLFFAQGYVHAQDRLWQMEMNRRVGYGRLAELFGEVAFNTDRLLRTLGFARAAINDLASVDAGGLHIMEMYARGVNAYLASARRGKRLPPEFTLLGFSPARWQPLDSVVWAKVMAWNLSANWDMELLRAAFTGKLGAARAAQLEPEDVPENPTIIPPAVFRNVATTMLEQLQEAETFPTIRMGGASNNWVVDGNKTFTGMPLLANDPHLAAQVPGIWYENHLVAPTFEVTGVSFPGVPWVVIGHNRDLAWGCTNAFPDVQDLYIEKANPANPRQFEFRGEWETATLVREEIRVKGRRRPHVEEVVVTRHGPIVNRVVPVAQPDTPPLALRWTGYEPSRITRAVDGVNRARSWADFCEALRYWTVPSQNFVYADRQGNIGYYQPGLIPIRSKGMGLVPTPGWTGEYEWSGWIPHEGLPHTFNPPEHLIVSANNQVVGDDYPYHLALDHSNGYRAARIAALLCEKEDLSPDDFAHIQQDFYCAPAQKLTVHLRNLKPRDPFERRALDELRSWDHNLTADSVAGGVYKTIEYFALRRIFGDKLGDDLVDYYIGKGIHPFLSPISLYYDKSLVTLERILRDAQSPWYRDVQTGYERSREEILALALGDAVAALREHYGDDASRWAWGNLHRVEFKHPLGARKPLGLLFNRPALPVGGDQNTVWQGAYVPQFPIKQLGFVPSWRQIIDLGDWDNSRAIHLPGQSGHPASKHYADMIGPWSRGEYHPLLWSRDRVESHAEKRLMLEADLSRAPAL